MRSDLRTSRHLRALRTLARTDATASDAAHSQALADEDDSGTLLGSDDECDQVSLPGSNTTIEAGCLQMEYPEGGLIGEKLKNIWILRLPLFGLSPFGVSLRGFRR